MANQTTQNGIPVEIGNGNGPIIVVYLIDEIGKPAIGRFTNFGQLSFNRDNLMETIEAQLVNYPNVKMVRVGFWNP